MNEPSTTHPTAPDAPGRNFLSSPTDLTGQVAVVTGASRGIGRGIATRLGNLGANVVVNYSRDAAGAEETAAAVEAAGAQAVAVQADVSQPDQVQALLKAAQTRFGGLNIVEPTPASTRPSVRCSTSPKPPTTA